MQVVKQMASSSITEKKSNGHSFFLTGEASLNKFKNCRDIPWLSAALVCYGGPGGEQWDLSEQCRLSAGWRRYLAWQWRRWVGRPADRGSCRCRQPHRRTRANGKGTWRSRYLPSLVSGWSPAACLAQRRSSSARFRVEPVLPLVCAVVLASAGWDIFLALSVGLFFFRGLHIVLDEMDQPNCGCY